MGDRGKNPRVQPTETLSDWGRRLNLTAEQDAALERLAAEQERSVAFVIRKAVQAMLAEEVTS